MIYEEFRFHNASANTLNGAPHSFSAFLKCYPSLPQVVVFFNIRVVGIPHTTEDERYIVSRVRSFEGIYIATLRLGYRDPIDLRNVAMPIRNAIVAIERTGGEEPESIQKRIEAIDESMKRAITHILPEFHISVEQGGTGNKVIRCEYWRV
jgi:KUP system potassium uptake protein